MRDAKDNRIFIATLFAFALVAWATSGERLLDAAYGMPDVGQLDDALLAALVTADGWRAALGAPDLFDALRATLHGLLGVA